MTRPFVLLTALTLLSVSPVPQALAAEPTPAEQAKILPAGDYKLDLSHASLIFRVSHLSFSNYTARFTRFDARLKFDPARPDAALLTATVDPTSIETDYPDKKTHDFNATLQNDQWLDTKKFPQITYTSTRIEMTGPTTARIHGDLTLHGVTKPLVLEAEFNGGYTGHPMEPNARIGFSATGQLKRSDFGISYGIPEPGTTMGVGDAVEIILETEFTGPPLKKAADSPR